MIFIINRNHLNQKFVYGMFMFIYMYVCIYVHVIVFEYINLALNLNVEYKCVEFSKHCLIIALTLQCNCRLYLF